MYSRTPKVLPVPETPPSVLRAEAARNGNRDDSKNIFTKIILNTCYNCSVVQQWEQNINTFYPNLYIEENKEVGRPEKRRKLDGNERVVRSSCLKLRDQKLKISIICNLTRLKISLIGIYYSFKHCKTQISCLIIFFTFLPTLFVFNIQILQTAKFIATKLVYRMC